MSLGTLLHPRQPHMAVCGRGAIIVVTSRQCFARARSHGLWGVLILGIWVLSACQTVPITGRQQLMLLSEPEAVPCLGAEGRKDRCTYSILLTRLKLLHSA